MTSHRSEGPDARPLRGLAGLAAMLLVACGGGQSPLADPSGGTPAEPWLQPVPKAQCAAGDRAETDVQGRVPLVDRVSGRSAQGYNCNLNLVGQFDNDGEGAAWQHAWHEDCAYFTTKQGDAQLHPGTVIVDARDPSRPVRAGALISPTMLDPHESLRAFEARELLVGAQLEGPEIAIYDLSQDCSRPAELFSGAVQTQFSGHEGSFSADGQTYYVSNNGGLIAYDLDDPTAPAAIASFPDDSAGAVHLAGATNEAGDIGYWPALGLIVDLSAVKSRADGAQIPVIGQLPAGGGGTQMARFIRIGGVPYVLGVDESIAGAVATLTDVSDIDTPRLVSRLMLEVHDSNPRVQYPEGNDTPIFGYDSHYCTEDDPQDTTAIACAYFQSGVRVFDVRDPYRPREIAYYNPPAHPGRKAGSAFALTGTCTEVDWATAHSRFRADRRELWITTQCNGFQILRFAAGVWPQG